MPTSTGMDKNQTSITHLTLSISHSEGATAFLIPIGSTPISIPWDPKDQVYDLKLSYSPHPEDIKDIGDSKDL